MDSWNLKGGQLKIMQQSETELCLRATGRPDVSEQTEN